MDCEYFESVFEEDEVTIASGGILMVDVRVGEAEDWMELVIVECIVCCCSLNSWQCIELTTMKERFL